MHAKTLSALLGYGFDTDLIAKIHGCGHTVAQLRVFSRAVLLASYTAEEANRIRAKVLRQPIAEDVIDEVLRKAGSACCYCNDGNSTRPYQLHHIMPWSETQDDTADNLALVCPTHHVAIHENALACDQQRGERKAWYAIVELANEYKVRGLGFPFGSVERLDYSLVADAREIVSAAPLSPSTAVLFTPVTLVERGLRSLNERHFLTIFGESGSGKSTYALGVAGHLAAAGSRIFRYRFDKTNPTTTLREVRVFLGVAVRPAVLILDDVNRWASSQDLQQLQLAAKESQVKIVATWANDGMPEDAQAKLSNPTQQTLIWDDLRPGVISVILSHEHEIVSELMKFDPAKGIGSLGVGPMNSGLARDIHDIEQKAKTVYEFVFLLRGARADVDAQLAEMASHDRADIAIVWAAIEQIAGFEQAVTVREATAVCDRLGSVDGLPIATEEWVHDELERQTRRRVLVRMRHAYTTIHRKWGVRLIAAALANDRTRHQTSTMLDWEFSVTTTRPERLLRLWSWLNSTDAGRAYTRTWVARQTRESWAQFVAICARAGLMPLGFLGDRLHLRFEREEAPGILGFAFGQNEESVSERVSLAAEDDWGWLKYLFRALDHACPEIAARIVSRWNPERVAKLIERTGPQYFDSITWLLSGISQHSREWVAAIGRDLDWNAFSRNLDRIEAGQLDHLDAAFTILRRVKLPYRRSTLLRYADVMRRVLEKVTLEGLSVPVFDPTRVIVRLCFPEDLRDALAALPIAKLAREMETSLPRHWKGFVSLWIDARDCDSEVPQQLADLLDIDVIAERAALFAQDYAGELHLLMFILRHASQHKREAFAANIYTPVRDAVRARGSNAGRLLSSYAKLSAKLCEQIARELDVPVPPDEEEKDTLGIRKKIRDEVRLRNANGNDFDLDFLFESDKEP